MIHTLQEIGSVLNKATTFSQTDGELSAELSTLLFADWTDQTNWRRRCCKKESCKTK